MFYQNLANQRCLSLPTVWISIIQYLGWSIFDWFDKLEQRSYLYTDVCIQAIKIWFSTKPRKPPDKDLHSTISSQHDQQTLFCRMYNHFLDTFTEIIIWYEDCLCYFFNLDINLLYWTQIWWSIIEEQIKTVTVFFSSPSKCATKTSAFHLN